jgi:hypothetical protein
MKNEGWTLAELVSELETRGMDIGDISASELARVLYHNAPEIAAADLAGQWPVYPPEGEP